MSRDFYLRIEGEDFVPLPVARSYWGPTLHGRIIGGLVARAAERERSDDPALVCSRLTIDLFRTAQLAPVQVTSRRIRNGRRIRVIEVTVTQDGEPIGQGTVVLLRQGDKPEGEFLGMPGWSGSPPGELGAPSVPAPGARWTAPWDAWPVTAPDGSRDGVWLRESLDLVQGEAITPLIRLALNADLASPMVHSSNLGLGFINVDYTVYVSREPVGELIGLQPLSHTSSGGLAVGQCAVYDDQGPLGYIGVCAIATAPVR